MGAVIQRIRKIESDISDRTTERDEAGRGFLNGEINYDAVDVIYHIEYGNIRNPILALK